MSAPFHLAIAVSDLEATRAFYVDVLGCDLGREAPRWIDFDMHGHQVSVHLGDETGDRAANAVDGDAVPVPHFGVILPMQAWRRLVERVRAHGVDFLLGPRVRFEGKPGEQATFFVRDPSGNALEFKAFGDPDRLFARADGDAANVPMIGPKRIVCLTEEPTEILYALGEQRRIVGISAYTERPPAARADKPIVSAFINGHVDKICALKPDLVIGFSDIQAELAAKLIKAGLQVLIFNQRSLAEIQDVILTIGRLVGRAAHAQALVDGYRARLDAIAAAAAKLPRKPRVYFEEWDEPTICGIRWVSELIELAGGVDVFAEKSRGAMAKERFVDAEAIAAANPDIVFASWCGKPFDVDAFATRPGLESVRAVVDGELHEIASVDILQPGPGALTDGVEALHAHIVRWSRR